MWMGVCVCVFKSMPFKIVFYCVESWQPNINNSNNKIEIKSAIAFDERGEIDVLCLLNRTKKNKKHLSFRLLFTFSSFFLASLSVSEIIFSFISYSFSRSFFNGISFHPRCGTIVRFFSQCLLQLIVFSFHFSSIVVLLPFFLKNCHLIEIS